MKPLVLPANIQNIFTMVRRGRGRPSKPPEERRTIQVPIVASKGEAEAITAAAKRAGKPRSIWLRELALAAASKL